MKLQVLLSIASIVSVVAEDVACLDAEECRARYEALEFTGGFYSAGGVDAFPYKGCYSKKGNVFFSLGSSEDMETTDLPPLVSRIWCQSSSETNKQIVPRQSFCSPTIVDIAEDDGRFTTLVAALEAADLVDTLAGPGPFTVFAPTDDAFAALPDGTVEALLDDIDQLTDILTYHVVAGAVFSDDLVDGEVATLNGESVTVDVTFDSIMINDSTVIIPDIEACNGVIHVIDEVLIPPGGDSAGGEVDDYSPPHKPHGWWSSPSKDYHHGGWSSSSKSGKSKSSKDHSDWSSKSNKSSKSGGHWSGDGWWSSSNSKKSKASWSKPSSSSHHSKPSKSKPSSSSHHSKPSRSKPSHHSKKN